MYGELQSVQQLALFDLGNNQPPVKYISNFLSSKEADKFYNYCQKLEWQQHNIKIMGKIMPVPRLECMYGDAGCNYLYSKSVLLEPLPWTDTLQELRSRIELKTGYKFNIVLCNRYRNGKDSVGWHNDNEPSMGISPAIASVSLGAERKFQLRLKNGGKPINFWLEHGSLLVMKPGCQENWVHQIPKTSLTVGERINLTFRPHINGSQS